MTADPHLRGLNLDLRPLPGGLGAEIAGFDFGAALSGERFDAVRRATTHDTATERRVIRRCTVLGDAPLRLRSRP